MAVSPHSVVKQDQYRQAIQDLTALFDGERDFLANMANCSAVLFQTLTDLNWAGFYLMKERDLVLGPFQGKPACTRIGPGRGVCGAAAMRRDTVIVPDVHLFPGHIACDSASESEIVIPMITSGRLIGVLDLDSPLKSRFDEKDARQLEQIVALVLASSDVTDCRLA